MATDLLLNPTTVRGLRHQVVEQILRAIIRGQLPTGQRLVVQRLATQLNVSATPAREALLELANIGVADLLPNRGAVVRRFGPVELQEMYHLRRILEIEATRCACRRIDRGELSTLREEMRNLTEQSGDDWSRREMNSDRRLHELIARQCGNARLTQEIQRYDTLMQAIRDVVGDRRQAQERAIVEHLVVVDGLLDEDSDRAAQGMTRHIENTAEVVTATLFPRNDRDPESRVCSP